MPNCPQCSTNQPQDSKYCAECGSSLDPATQSAAGDATVVNPNTPRPGSSSASASKLSDSSGHGRFLPGAVLLDRYRIVSLLGAGGMGEVYRADDLQLGHPVALKFMSAQLAADPDKLDFFRNEVRISRQVSHPHVCRVYDIGECEGQVFLSMEYVDGGDLKELLRRIGRLEADKALELARQLCAGLSAAHDKGVLHRDLKPANIMLDERGSVRITDFGLATMSQDATPEGGIVGTAAYMAPEQLTHGEASIQSDLYSLGLTLYEMFTGKPLHTASSINELIKAHEESSFARPSELVPELNPEIERTIVWCLEREPRDRPSSAMAVAAALPGGDALAAVLAAGETPSPEMVAAATHGAGTFTRVKATLLFVCLLANILVVAYLNPKVRLSLATGVGDSPQVLVHRAREIVTELGYGDEPLVDHAHGHYFHKDAPALRELRYSPNRNPGDLKQIETAVPAVARTWYRQRPYALVSDHVDGRIFPYSYPVLYHGDIIVEVSQRGDLVEFMAVPPKFHDSSTTSVDCDWSRAFELANLDYSRFRATAPMTLSAYGEGQKRSAWLGPPNSGAQGAELRVEGSEVGGRPVRFSVLRAEDVSNAIHSHKPSTVFGYVGFYSRMAFYYVIVATGLWLAYRNLRQHRGDRRGAFRLAVFSVITGVVGWVCLAHHSPTGVVARTSAGVGGVLCAAGVAYALYLAFEPAIRSTMPRLLVSWTRLLGGHWRDPMVARDVLIGLAWTPFYTLSTLLFFGIESWQTGGMGYLDGPYINRMESVLHVVYGYTRGVTEYGIIMGLCLLAFYVGVLKVTRRPVLAIPIYIVLLAAVVTFWFSGISLVGNIAASVVLALSTTILLLRYGLLATVTLGTAFHVIWASPLSLDSEVWYFSTGLVNGGLLLALAALAFRRSQPAPATNPG